MIMTACDQCGKIGHVVVTTQTGIALRELHQFDGDLFLDTEFRCLDCITGIEWSEELLAPPPWYTGMEAIHG